MFPKVGKKMSKSKAIYKVIRESIVQDILSGVYESGDMINGQDYYAKKFDVSRATVRKAIDYLLEKQVLYTVKGKGTFVSKMRNNQNRERRKLSFSESPRIKEHKFETVLYSLSYKKADYKIAKQLQINIGDEVVKIERIRVVDGIAENYQTSFINYNLVRDINFESENLENVSLFGLLGRKSNLIPKYSDEEIRAVSCPKKIGEKLSIEEGEPILFIQRVTYTDENIVMEYCEDYECSDIKGLKVRTFT